MKLILLFRKEVSILISISYLSPFYQEFGRLKCLNVDPPQNYHSVENWAGNYFVL